MVGSSGSIHQLHYTFVQKVETCTVRLTVPETIETVTLSVAIDTGVGAPPARAPADSENARAATGNQWYSATVDLAVAEPGPFALRVPSRASMDRRRLRPPTPTFPIAWT